MNRIIFLFLLLLTSCFSPSKEGLKVVATAVPHAELLEYIKPDLKELGISLEIIIADDYNVPNRALAGGEVDANFFQHLPFLKEQVKHFQYPIEGFVTVELEPMGIYSKKIHAIKDLREDALIALPNDPTNEGRALLVLQKEGVIEVDPKAGLSATVLHIVKNPKKIRFIEVDAAMVARSLDDVDAAVLNTNYALQAGLSPLTDALALEGKDSPYANIIAIRKGDENRADLQALRALMTSEKMRDYILEKYKGAILPTF